LIFGHPVLAVTGLLIWIVYLASDTDALRWVAFAILMVVAALGFTMARLWRQERAATVAAAGADRTVLAPEQHFPVPLIGVHGLLALTTLALVPLTASASAIEQLVAGNAGAGRRVVTGGGCSSRPQLGWWCCPGAGNAARRPRSPGSGLVIVVGLPWGFLAPGSLARLTGCCWPGEEAQDG
jgi:hypothetical protein